MSLLHRHALPPATREQSPAPSWVVQLATVVSRAAVLLAVVVGLVWPERVLEHQVWVLAAGFLLGLPHGAVDHLLPLRHRWVRRGPVGLAGVVVAYVALAAVAYAGLRLAGPVALPALLALSVLHFGWGDLATTSERAAEQPRSRWERLLGAVGRGAPVLAGPLLVWPGPTGTALAAVGLGAVPSRTTDSVVGVVLLGVSVLAALDSFRRGRTDDVVEVALLVALFTVVPPVAAFGVYFGLWHGLRHTARLVVDDPGNAVDLVRGRLAAPVGRFLTAAAAPSLAALVTVLVLVRLAAGRADLVPPVFAVLLALTVPHVVVVGLWDHRAGRHRTGGSR